METIKHYTFTNELGMILDTQPYTPEGRERICYAARKWIASFPKWESPTVYICEITLVPIEKITP